MVAPDGRVARRRTSAHRIPKMAEIVASELRSEILNGEPPVGESLQSEAALMERFDVSRPTLREALRLLESQQLITVKRGSHRGPVAALPDAQLTARSFALLMQLRRGTTADIYQFRMIFKPQAALLAAENATEAQLSELRDILAAERAAQDDFGAFTVAAWQFHTAIARLSGNVAMALMAETMEQISKQHAEASTLAVGDVAEARERAIRAHARLLELIAARRGKEAERFWSKHMAVAGEQLLAGDAQVPILELLE